MHNSPNGSWQTVDQTGWHRIPALIERSNEATGSTANISGRPAASLDRFGCDLLFEETIWDWEIPNEARVLNARIYC